MKAQKRTIHCLFAIIALTVTFAVSSCSGKSKEPSPLVAESEVIAGYLGELAENSPLYLDSITVDYNDAILRVNVGFADPAVNIDTYSHPLVEFIVSVFIKNHPGKDLDLVINTLNAEKGNLLITLGDTMGHKREYNISAARLKNLYTLKPMELSFPEVRTNVCEILEQRCAAYKDAYNAENAVFDLTGGFAQYTLTFKSASAYSNLTQDSLRGRYQNVLRQQFDIYGDCRTLIEDLLKTLQIEGYRFVYTDAKETKTLKAALPWRIIE